MKSAQVAVLVARANQGDMDAWTKLVEEYSDMLWSITRRFRLSEAQGADAVQNTWLSLIEHLGEIRQPERLAGWLATTVRRACLASIGESKREHPSDATTGYLEAAHAGVSGQEHDCPEGHLVQREHYALVHSVLAELPVHHRRLMDLLMRTPSPCYQEVSRQLGLPVGSIGPTRQRILARMRVRLAAQGLDDLALS
jgi:RNA polymerase sigma factor (sigma-70 family)